MKLTFLPNVNAYDEHYIRLNDFDMLEASLFRNVIQSLAENTEKQVVISECSFIEAVNCELILRVSEEDEGITTEDNKHFFCDLSSECYAEMVKLIQPFCTKKTDAYQFLYDLDIPIDFLFSSGKELLIKPE